MGQLRDQFVIEMGRAVRQANTQLQRALKENAPDSANSPPSRHSRSRSTGRTTRKLKDAISVAGPDGGAGGVFRSAAFTVGAPQAGFTNDGTAAHIILPRRRQVLAFQVAGEDVIAARVEHPGTPATHWFDNTVRDDYDRLLEDAIDQHVA